MGHPYKELCFIDRKFSMPGTSLWLAKYSLQL